MKNTVVRLNTTFNLTSLLVGVDWKVRRRLAKGGLVYRTLYVNAHLLMVKVTLAVDLDELGRVG